MEAYLVSKRGFVLSGTTAVAVVSGCYVAAQMLADIGSLRILLIFGLSVDGGTLVYPLTFTLRDMVHKVAGIRTARALIVAAAAINIFMAIVFWAIGALPADPMVGPQTEFVAILAPVWRIVIASIIAEVVSEMLDGEVYQKWVDKYGRDKQWARVLVSNGASLPVDSVLFAVLAFAGTMPWSVVVSIIAANVILKFAFTLLGMPLIYAVKEADAE
jgi:uncharacterized integral membrane protein (TIGR00697 family)